MGGSFRIRGWGIVDARSIAASWARPYTSVQWAWVRALGVDPSTRWVDAPSRTRARKPRRRDMREAMDQRHGVRGL